MKWFEKKWFVNLKLQARLNISFLSVAVIAVASDVAGIVFLLSLKAPHAYAIIIGVIAIFIIIIALVLGNINAFLILDPMAKNQRIIEMYSCGDFDAKRIIRERDKTAITFKDEIGEFSRKMQDLLKYLKNLEACIRQVSEGDLTVAVPVCSPKDQIGNRLSELVNNFHGLTLSIATATDKVSSGSNLVADSSLLLSQGAMQQASTVQELTASLEQIASQTRLNAQNSEQANTLTKNVKENAVDGNIQMKEMLNAMDDISISSSDIGKIIKVIDDIAFQTNILALNAAVEAARAGQHGKGFAVVAEEVRNLAGKSATAAKESTEMIENSIKKVEAGTKIANRTAKALDEIVSEVDRADTLINSMTISSAEQAQGIEQINLAIAQVSHVIQTIAATAQESAAASEELTGQATHLEEQVSVFKLNKSNTAPVVINALKEVARLPISSGSMSAKQSIN